jgi:hypothetical protein
MTFGRALSIAAAAMLATACGALGFPEPRAPLHVQSESECPHSRNAGQFIAPSGQMSSALMP